jgi:hypothetical protein
VSSYDALPSYSYLLLCKATTSPHAAALSYDTVVSNHLWLTSPVRKRLLGRNGNNQQFSTTSTLTTQNSLRRGTDTINSDNASTTICLCLYCCIAAASSVEQANLLTVVTTILSQQSPQASQSNWLEKLEVSLAGVIEIGLMLSLLR